MCGRIGSRISQGVRKLARHLLLQIKHVNKYQQTHMDIGIYIQRERDREDRGEREREKLREELGKGKEEEGSNDDSDVEVDSSEPKNHGQSRVNYRSF